MEKPIKILFIEDNPSDAEIILRQIKKDRIQFDKKLVETRDKFLSELNTFRPDIIVSDYSLPHFDGMTALQIRNEITPLIPFILVTGSINEEVAVECIKAGADDYILKNNLSRLGLALVNSINNKELLKKKLDAETALRESEERFRVLYNDAVVGLYRTNLQGEIILANKTLVKMLGFGSFEELARRNLKETGYGPSYQREVFINQIEKDGEVKDLEAIWICRDGSEIFVRESAKAIYDSNGEILYYDGTVQDITEQKRAAEALNKIQNLFETLTIVSPAGIFRTDANGYTTYVNPKWMELSGLSFEESIGFGWLKAVHPDDREHLKKRWKSDVKTKISSNAEYRFQRSDGSIVWVIGNAVPELTDNKIVGYIGTITDITKQKLADEAIKESQQIVEGILNTIPVRVFWKDKNLVYMGCNKVFASDAGFEDPKDIMGKNDYQMGWHYQAELYRTDDLQVIESGNPKFNIEEILTTSEGNTLNILTNKVPLRNSKGEISGILGAYIDITERKQAEEKLLQSYMFNESLLKTIPFGMDIVNEEGTVMFLGDNFKRIFGDEAVGAKCWEIYRDDKKQCVDCPLHNGINVGETEVYESHGVLGDRIFEIIHTGMIYAGKKAMLEIFQDITDKKRNEEELIMAKEKAEESDRLKTAFLHNISHEIRTPMNAIVGFSTLLGEPDVDSQTRQSYFEVIMQSSNHLLAIISDIVDISNIEANLVKISLNEININSFLQSIYNQFLQIANDKNLNLSYETNLSDTETLILIDNTKLNQILTNLIGNAFKFTEKGNIKITCYKKDSNLEFSISDTGIGIPPEYHERIFDRFYQVNNELTRDNEGTGLGLSITKAYIELMGGKIDLTSDPGNGTTFYFSIPYKKQSEVTIPSIEKSVNEEFVFQGNKTVLIAEDIDSNFKLINYFFNGTNINLLRASNGKEAVEMALSERKIDLILMDIRMPVMDGYTATKLIREANISIPIIAQTAYAEDTEKAMKFGCNGLISKPFDKMNLLLIVKKFLNNGN
jgi:PAS domain S-box-containing protein